MLQVPHGLQGQLPQGEQARLAVDGGAGPCLGRLRPQDAGGVPPQCLEQGQLFVEVEPWGGASSLTWPDRTPSTRFREYGPLSKDQSEGAARLSKALRQRCEQPD